MALTSNQIVLYERCRALQFWADCFFISVERREIMSKVEKSVTIKAPVEKVFDYTDDPNSVPEWLPSLIETRDVTGSGVGMRYRWTYKMVGVRLEGESEVTEHIPSKRRVIQTKGGAVSTWVYTFEPHDGGTKLTLNIEYTIPVPVLGKLAEKLVLKRNEREAEMALVNIKDKMEG
jgi:uncharacterized membrane protein